MVRNDCEYKSEMNVDEYAAMLEKLMSTSTDTEKSEDDQEFARLDAWGKKNADFLNQFSPDTIAKILWFGRHHEKREGWTDELWTQDVKRRVLAGRNQAEVYHLGRNFEGPNLLGFEILYAAGGVVEFRRKLRKGFGNEADGRWHIYQVPCRFIDGDVRPFFDGQWMKPSGLLRMEKVYRFKG